MSVPMGALFAVQLAVPEETAALQRVLPEVVNVTVPPVTVLLAETLAA